MALGVSEEHLELAASVRGWAERYAGPDTGAERYTDELRPALAGQGLLGLHLPEDCGGQGYGLSELAVAVEELGYALVPGGFLPTVLAAALLAPPGVPPGRRHGQAAGRAGGRVAVRGRRAGSWPDRHGHRRRPDPRGRVLPGARWRPG